MFCENCGNKLGDGHNFCIKCGYPSQEGNTNKNPLTGHFDQKWWLRLIKVFYILLYIPLPFILFGVWTSNSPYSYYSSYSREWISSGSYGKAFWYSLLTFVIWIIVLRLLKITFLYIYMAQKPQWKKEFKKFF